MDETLVRLPFENEVYEKRSNEGVLTIDIFCARTTHYFGKKLKDKVRGNSVLE
ncbi:hypothetical protein KIN20_013280 [Parelaphostrongylus tenuis]|uniref:Uncharacterized protein n=1 Tax=Parelaphostrongylus tenuis TaxID=148309 RepID=A0AAD5MUF3_PARTN|nr:hypothetical protein KIN20_013280 [Parelaphostrongylus tenuis]